MVIVAIYCTVVVYFVYRVLFNKRMDWKTINSYLFSGNILAGVRTTIILAIGSQVLAIGVALLLAMARRSRHKSLSFTSWAYIALFRATPLLVQILVWYNLAYFFPRLGIGVPFTSLGVSASTNSIITPFSAALFGLALNEAAYLAEVIRSAVDAVPGAQVEAAMSLGMTKRMAYARIIFPQALRIALPPMGNQFIGLLKATSLVSVVGGGDLLTRVQLVYQSNFQIFPLLFVACIWYVVLTTVTTIAQTLLERRLNRAELAHRAETGVLRDIVQRLTRPSPSLSAIPGQTTVLADGGASDAR
jgi:polar amino acid transport system permease protein